MVVGEFAVEGVLWAVLSFTVLKTVLVANAMWDSSKTVKKILSFSPQRSLRSASATPASPASPRLSNASASASGTKVKRSRGRRVSRKFRSVHRRLLLMHFLGTMAQLAGIAQYVISMTDLACVLAHRVMMASLVLFDATVVIFLLAKTQVTANVMSGSGNTSRLWERAVWIFSNFLAWICLPALAIVCTIALPGGMKHEDGGCHGAIESFNGDRSSQVFFIAFMTGKIVLTAEFLLLLALFIKPLFAQGDDGRISIRSRHRRTVLRNITCTIGVVAVQLAEAVVVYTVVYHKGHTEDVERSADVAAVTQVFLTLCFTEITIPLGFASFFAWALKKWRPKKDGSGESGQRSCMEVSRNSQTTAYQVSAYSSAGGGMAVNANNRQNRSTLGGPWRTPVHVINEDRELMPAS